MIEEYEYNHQYLMEPKASEMLQFAANLRWTVALLVTSREIYVCMSREHYIRDKSFRRDSEGRAEMVAWLLNLDYI